MCLFYVSSLCLSLFYVSSLVLSPSLVLPLSLLNCSLLTPTVFYHYIHSLQLSDRIVEFDMPLFVGHGTGDLVTSCEARYDVCHFCIVKVGVRVRVGVRIGVRVRVGVG